MQPLKHLRVIELAGLAPAPFCGMILADFGANVIVVKSPKVTIVDDLFSRGKHSILLDLKKQQSHNLLHKLLKKSDVLIDPFRPGIIEKLGFAPKTLHESNPGLIIAQITGYGQLNEHDKENQKHQRNLVGHDLLYLGMSGLLSKLGEEGKPPSFPLNILGDFAGGGLMGALGIMLALYSRNVTGKGEVVDVSMTHSVSYLSAFVRTTLATNPLLWPNILKRQSNLLDGGAPFYRCYVTKDNKYMAVAALELNFFENLLEYLSIDVSNQEHEQYNQFDVAQWPAMTDKFSSIFSSENRDYWIKRIHEYPLCCVSPVLDMDEAAEFWPGEHYYDKRINSWQATRQPRLHSCMDPEYSKEPTVEDLRKLLKNEFQLENNDIDLLSYKGAKL